MGSDLWDLIWDAGQPYNIKPGCPNLIERIEGGLMSYGNEFTLANNPLECGFDRLCHLGDEIRLYWRAALRQIAADGPVQSIRGIRFGGDKAPPCGKPFPVTDLNGVPVGQITSGIYSPRLNCNIGMSMIRKTHWDYGTQPAGSYARWLVRDAVVSKLPF